MKRTERHHLKENEVVEWVLGLKEWFEANRRAVTYGGIAIGVLALAVAGTAIWRQSSANRAGLALAQAMTVVEARVAPPAPAAEGGQPPAQQPGTYPSERAKLEAALPLLLGVADTYPSTPSGMIARYRAGAALVALGRTDEGVQKFQEVAARATGVYQAMARLGMADAFLASGQYDKAIAEFQNVVSAHPDDTPIDGVLMELGRAYRLAGKPEDAAKTFKRVADEFPQSPYAPQARREIES